MLTRTGSGGRGGGLRCYIKISPRSLGLCQATTGKDIFVRIGERVKRNTLWIKTKKRIRVLYFGLSNFVEPHLKQLVAVVVELPEIQIVGS